MNGIRRIWGFGSAAIDFRIQTADYGDQYKEKLIAQQTQLLGGGSVANALIQAARLGGKTGWLGKLGDDMLGKMIVSMLVEEGLDCNQIIYGSGMCSPFNLAAYRGENRIRTGGFLLPNSLDTLSDLELHELSACVQEHDIVLVEIGEIRLETIIQWMRLLRKRKATMLIDFDLDPIRQCGGTPDQVDEICSTADILIPNKTATASLCLETESAKIVQYFYEKYHTPVIITDGGNGVYYTTDGTQKHQSAYTIPAIVDTVGAGDAFHGGFAYAMSAGADFDDAVDMGSLCGAMNCMEFGARSGMPCLLKLNQAREGWKNEQL